MTTLDVDLKVSNVDIKESFTPKAFFNQLTSKVNKIIKLIFNTNQEVTETRSVAKGNFIEFNAVVGDTTSAISTVDAAYNAAMHGNPTSPVATGDALGGGIISMVTGPQQSMRGALGVQESVKNRDEVGLVTSSIKVARGVSDTASGGATAAIAGVSIANATSKATKVLRTLGWVAVLGTGFTGCAVMVTSAIGLVESFSISTKLAKANDDTAALKVLKEKLLIQDEDRKKILDQLFSGKKAPWYTQIASSFTNILFRRDQTQEKEKLKLQEKLQTILKTPNQLQNFDVTDLKAATSLPNQEIDFIKNYLEGRPDFTKEQKEQLLPLLAVIYQDELGRAASKKETVFNRTVGSKTSKLIKELSSSSDLKAIVKCAKREIAINQGMNLSSTLLGALGVAVTLMAQFATGGVYTLVELGIGLATAVAWLFLDGYTLYQAFKNNPSTTKDKIFMVGGVLLTFATTVLAVVVTRMTNHLLPVIALATLASLFMLYVVYKWKKVSNDPAPKPGGVNVSINKPSDIQDKVDPKDLTEKQLPNSSVLLENIRVIN